MSSVVKSREGSIDFDQFSRLSVILLECHFRFRIKKENNIFVGSPRVSEL